jgi:outer membrane lipoprotein-sorting protein
MDNVALRFVKRAGLGSLLVGISLSFGPAIAKPAPPKKPDPAPYMRQLSRIGGELRDFQAMLDANIVEPGSPQPTTFRIRVAARMPDSVRMDVLESNKGLFRGWKFARVGSSVRVYDPISERSTAMDLRQMTGRQPIRMDLGIDMAAGIFRPNNFIPTVVGPTTLDGKPALLFKLKPKPSVNDPASVVKLSYILLWMDPVKKAPLKQESWGWPPRHARAPVGDPIRLLTTVFEAFKPAGAGLWYPSQVKLLRSPSGGDRHAPSLVQLKLARVNGTLVPTEVSAKGGGGSSLFRYSDIRVNAGLPANAFRPDS